MKGSLVLVCILAMAMLSSPIAAQSRDEQRKDLMEKLRAADKTAQEADEAERHNPRDRDAAEIEKVLDTARIDLEFTDSSMEDIIGYIREKARINIEIDERVREREGTEKKLTVKLKDTLLRTALESVLAQCDADYVWDHKVLLIIDGASRGLPASLAWTVARGAIIESHRRGMPPNKADEEVRQKLDATKMDL